MTTTKRSECTCICHETGAMHIVACCVPDDIIEEPVNEWFGLSRDSYFVIPRLALEALPVEWQKKFVALMDEAYEKHGLETPSYHVLRNDIFYTYVEPYDSEDVTSRDYEFTALSTDPWADYRRGSVEELTEQFKRNGK